MTLHDDIDDEQLELEPGGTRSFLVIATEHALGRLTLAITVVSAFMMVYMWINNNSTNSVDLFTPLDAAIPFWPGTIFVYFSMYLLFAAAAVHAPSRVFMRGMTGLVLVALVSCIFFLAMPAHYPRPDPATIENDFVRAIFEQMFSTDPPGNTFPSLHVGTTTMCVLMLRKSRARWLFAAWALAICLSTLTVKQHFVVDVVGGIALAGLGFLWVRRFL